jgi:hypothetical protein
MPKRHPTVQVPDIGPMDHAWDVLGELQAEFELPESESPVHGKVTFLSWGDAELQLDPIEAAIAGIPSACRPAASEVPSHRRRRCCSSGCMRLRQLVAPATLWPVVAPVRADPEDEGAPLPRPGDADGEYYLRKYASGQTVRALSSRGIGDGDLYRSAMTVEDPSPRSG